MSEWQSVHLPYELDEYDRRRISYRVDRLIELARIAVRGIKTPRILDIGSGRGEFISAAQTQLGADVMAIDIDPVCIAMARGRGVAYEGELPAVFAEYEKDLVGAADLVVSSHSLEHMRDPIAAITAMKKISRGALLFALPNPHCLSMIVKVVLLNRIPQINKGHYWAWDAPHLSWFLHGQMGLDIVQWSADWVPIVPRGLARRVPIDRITGLIESKLLPRMFPRLAESLIVLCRKGATA